MTGLHLELTDNYDMVSKDGVIRVEKAIKEGD
jgi:hypothetical protein